MRHPTRRLPCLDPPSWSQARRSAKRTGPGTGSPSPTPRWTGLLATLDAMLTIPETVNDFSVEAPLYFSIFGHRIQRGRLSDDQTRRIVASINAAGRKASRRRGSDRETTPQDRIPDSGARRPEHSRKGHRRRRVRAGGLSGEHRRADLFGAVVWTLPGTVPLSSCNARAVRGPAGRIAGGEQRRRTPDDPRRQGRRGTRLPYLVGRTRRRTDRGTHRHRLEHLRLAQHLCARRGRRDPLRPPR